MIIQTALCFFADEGFGDGDIGNARGTGYGDGEDHGLDLTGGGYGDGRSQEGFYFDEL